MVTSPPSAASHREENAGQVEASTTLASEFSILLFAGLKDAAQTGEIVVRLNAQTTTVRALLDGCADQYPDLARWLPHVKVAVNQEYSQMNHTVSAHDEIALLPPVAGGKA